LCERGRVQRQLGRLRESLADLTTAIRLRPRQIPFYLERAQTYAALKKYPSALADFQKPRELEPYNPMWLDRLAWVLTNRPAGLRDPGRALPLAKEAVRREPSMLYHHTLGTVYYRLGGFRRARACFERNLRINAASGGYNLFFLAMCHYRQGEIDRARACPRQGIAWRKAPAQVRAIRPTELDAVQAEAEALVR
jgi:tetratricopeptide (TPR) repeat protein